MAEASASIELEARLRDFVTSRVQQMRMGFTSSFARMQKSAANFGARMSSMFSSVKSGIVDFAKRFGPAAIVVGALTTALFKAGRAIEFVREKAVNFESTMSKVQSILRPSRIEMENLSTQAEKLGRTTAFSASQAGEAFVEMGKLGFQANEIIASSSAVLDLAAVAQTGMADAAEVTVKTLNQFGLEADQATQLTDVMAKSFTTTALDMTKFRESMKFVGTSARLAGLDVETTTALLGVMADNGLEASSAGTALNQMLIQLVKEGSNANKMLDQMGFGGADVITKMKALRDSGIDVGQVFDLLDVRAGRAANVIFENIENIDGLTQSFKAADGAAADMAKTMLDNVAGATKILQSAQEGLALAIGEAFGEQKIRRIKIMTEFTNRLTTAAEEQRGTLFQLSKLWTDIVSSVTGVSDADLAVNEKISDLNEGQLETLIEMRRQYDLMMTVQESLGGGVGSKVAQMTGKQAQKIEAILGVSRSILGVNVDRLEFESLTDKKLREQLQILKEQNAERKKPGPGAAPVDDLTSSNLGFPDKDAQDAGKKEAEKFSKEVESIRIAGLKRTLEGELSVLEERRSKLVNNENATNAQIAIINQEFQQRQIEAINRFAEEQNQIENSKEQERFNQEQQMRALRVAAMEEGMQRELAALNVQKDAELRKFKDNEEAKALIQEKFANQRMKVEKKFSKQKQDQLDREKRANQQLTDSIISDSSRGLQALISNEKQAKKIALITSIIQGVLAVQRAIANPPGFPFNAPQVAATAIKAAANTATIASQSFQEGGFPVGQNALVRVNEAGQEAVLNAGATARLGRGQINNLNAGRGSTTVTNEISYSPTITVAKSTEENVLDVLRNDKEAFAEFVQRDVIDKGFLSLQD